MVRERQGKFAKYCLLIKKNYFSDLVVAYINYGCTHLRVESLDASQYRVSIQIRIVNK